MWLCYYRKLSVTIIEIHQIIMKRKRNSENQQLFGRVRVAHVFFCVLYYSSDSRLVMFVAIAVKKLCSVRLYLQLFVGGLMSYLRYLCLLAHSDVQQILCCVFVFIICVLYCLTCVASFSGLSIFDCPFGIL